jgi:hypothetical protein
MLADNAQVGLSCQETNLGAYKGKLSLNENRSCNAHHVHRILNDV